MLLVLSRPRPRRVHPHAYPNTYCIGFVLFSLPFFLAIARTGTVAPLLTSASGAFGDRECVPAATAHAIDARGAHDLMIGLAMAHDRIFLPYPAAAAGDTAGDDGAVEISDAFADEKSPFSA